MNYQELLIEPLHLNTPEIPVAHLEWKLSFRPYLRYVERLMQETGNEVYREYLSNISQKLQSFPKMLEPSDNCEVQDGCEEILKLLSVPPAGLNDNGNDIFAVGIPFPFTAIFYSRRFQEIFKDEDENRLSELVLDEYLRKIYSDILTGCYGLTIENPPVEQHFIRFRINKATPRYYYLIVNSNYREISCKGELPEVKEEWQDFASNKIHSFAKLKDTLPLDKFVAEGFLTFKLIDRTEEECMTELRKTAAEMHTKPVQETFKKIRELSLALIGEEHLEMGLLTFLKVNDNYAFHNAFRYSSILFSRLYKDFDRVILEEMYHNMVKEYISREEFTPLIFNSLGTASSVSEPTNPLASYDLKSMAFFPVWNHGMLLGVVELGSKEAAYIDEQLMKKIEAALPVYREFLVYQITKVNENINSFILRRYTSIQPCVKWKFNESSWQFLNAPEEQKKDKVLPEVRFEKLQAYYGACDIRNSSIERIKALNTDFRTQLSGAKAVLEAVCLGDEDTYADEQLAQISELESYISENITLEQEEGIREFIYESLGKIDYLRDKEAVSDAIATTYIENVRNEDSVFYAASANYEKSINSINGALKKILERYENKLQEQLPIYFEKFKTDGWEYNLYSGRELSPTKMFPHNAAEKILSWQFELMIELANTTRTLENLLPHKLQTTQLLLSHFHPLNINFRIDERRFDVDGAYSIRYEVIKKRIDKVCIVDTGERLTQPGSIAIVYSSDKQAEMYQEQLQKLIEAGKIEPQIEQYKLERLQGITGLKALRVKLKF